MPLMDEFTGAARLHRAASVLDLELGYIFAFNSTLAPLIEKLSEKKVGFALFVRATSSPQLH